MSNLGPRWEFQRQERRAWGKAEWKWHEDNELTIEFPGRFMQSDPWWSLAMAVNVFLVFYFHTNPDSFRKRWWIYCLICYGGPFVIALTLLLLRSPRGPVYGGATVSNLLFSFESFH